MPNRVKRTVGSSMIDFDKELADAQRESQESTQILTQHGFMVDTAEWLTIKHYAEKYAVSQQVVVNWIGRGVIPSDCTMTVPELNDIRLIKDQSFK